MDPVTLIVAALVAGASAGLKDTATVAIKDAYAGLKSLIRHRFQDSHAAASSAVHNEISAIEQGQQTDTGALHSALKGAGADQDGDLVRAAADMLKRLDPTGAAAGKYNVTISGGKGIVVGNEGSVSMTFHEAD